jgi:hypothetical protein
MLPSHFTWFRGKSTSHQWDQKYAKHNERAERVGGNCLLGNDAPLAGGGQALICRMLGQIHVRLGNASMRPRAASAVLARYTRWLADCAFVSLGCCAMIASFPDVATRYA